MTDQTDMPHSPVAPGDITLEHDIVVADKVVLAAGTTIRVRKPMGGALRGANLGGLIRMDFNQVALVAPRVTDPILHAHMIDAMDPSDVTQIAGVLCDFLLPTSTKEVLSRAT